MIREHDSVVLTADLPASGLVAGDVGVVVHVYDEAAAFEVEFVNFDGQTIAVESVKADAVRRVGTRDVPHVRTAAAWDQELSRRLDAIEAGTAVLIDRDDLRERLKSAIADGRAS